MKKISLILMSCLLITSCGDFPDYRYEQSEETCMMSFPFAAGVIGRKYIGYLNIMSTLQYLDADPEIEIFIGEPSHIDLEIGSVQKIEINKQFFKPVYHKNYLQPEFQYWGPAFTFDKADSAKIYEELQAGFDITFYGRVEVGVQYETDVYNFFFDNKDKPFKQCVNRLLNDADLKQINNRTQKAH